jgi:hypothetical protein
MRCRLLLLCSTVITITLAAATFASADAPLGAQQFQVQAQQIIAAATVTYMGNAWGPIPLYEVNLQPALAMTIDVADYSADAARNDPSVLASVETTLWQNAGSPPAPGAPPATAAAPGTVSDAVQPFVAQATSLVAAAPATYVGNSWGPEPIYELNLLQPLNMTVDVYAYTAAAANSDAGAIGVVAEQLWQNAGSPPAPNNNPAPQTPTTTTTSTPQNQSAAVDAAVPASPTLPAAAVIAPPVIPAVPMDVSSGMTFAPSIKITLSAPAAKQATVAATLTKALGTKVTLAKTIRLTDSGKVSTLAKVKSLLAKGRSVKVSLHKVNGKYVVTGIAL